MDQVQNNIVIPSFRDNQIDAILTSDWFKDFNAAPMLRVILEDYNRPHEFIKWLKILLEADKKLYNLQLLPDKAEYKERRYFIKELIEAIKAGIPKE